MVGGGEVAEGSPQSLREGAGSLVDSVLQPGARGRWPSPPGQSLSAEIPSRWWLGGETRTGISALCVLDGTP